MNPDAASSHTASDAAGVREEWEHLLGAAARLMLEYNFRASILTSRIERLSKAGGLGVRPSVSYRQVALCFDDGRCVLVQAPEYRLNVFISASLVRLIERVCAGTLDPAAALAEMRSLEGTGGCHGRWPLAALFALAASALACILQADVGAVIVTGVSSALGLLARRELARRHRPLFSLPFVAAAIGGIIGGLAVRMGWTHTPGICLMVPLLMLVPGPHLINGVFDVFENHTPSGVSRLVLAAGILLIAALGVFAGGWVIMGLRDLNDGPANVLRLTLWTDVLLAGIAACGFGAFYNSPWRVLWISIVCGMIGHGVRFVCLEHGAGLPSATFLACAAIGLLTNAAARSGRLPFSSVAFAAAVPMMPGSLFYRSIAGAARLAASGAAADPADATRTLVNLLQALLTVGAMAAGLAAGALVASATVQIVKSCRGSPAHA